MFDFEFLNNSLAWLSQMELMQTLKSNLQSWFLRIKESILLQFNSELYYFVCKFHSFIVTEQLDYSELEREERATEITNVFSVFFILQFGNNNNYMNMADANGALLAGDVSICLRITFTFPWIVSSCHEPYYSGITKQSFPCLTIYCFKTKSINLACMPVYVQIKWLISAAGVQLLHLHKTWLAPHMPSWTALGFSIAQTL